MTKEEAIDPRVYEVLMRLNDIGAYVQPPHIIIRRNGDQIGALVDTLERIINRVEAEKPGLLRDLECVTRKIHVNW